MKIDAFIFCYNEEKMIRHTLDHYSSFCDRITIMDNYSNDETITIITNEYQNVKITSFETNNQCREDIQTNLKNNCWKKSKADYVIVCDMDELLYSDNFNLALEKLNKYKPSVCSVIGYEMFSKKFPRNYNKSIIKQIKYGIRNYMFDKTILFSPKYVKEINYDYGAHTCNPKFKNKYRKNPLVEFKLLHYKYLDRKALIDKHKKYACRLSDINIKREWGVEYLDGENHINDKFKKAKKHAFKIIP